MTRSNRRGARRTNAALQASLAVFGATVNCGADACRAVTFVNGAVVNCDGAASCQVSSCLTS
jgi:hypothetical protein